MATREEKIQLIDSLKQQGFNRTQIKERLIQLDEQQAAKELPSITPEKFTPAEQPTGTQAAFPRATATGERTGQPLPIGRQISGGLADILSLPGRGVTAGLQTFGQPPEKFKESVAKTKGKGLAESIARSPSTGAAAIAAPLTGLGSLGVVSRGLIEGAAGAAGTQAEKFAEEGKVSPVGAIAETALGGAVPGAAKLAAPIAKGGRKLLGRTLQETTGVSEEALSKFGTGIGKGARELEEASGTQFEIAQDLVNRLDNIDDALPNKADIDQILAQSPDISTKNVIKTLNDAKTFRPVGEGKGANKKIDQFIKDIEEQSLLGSLTASDFRNLRIQIDREIGDQFGKESSAFISALKKARNTAKEDLLANTPSEFADIMKEFTEKLGVADRLKAELGKTASTREARAEAFVSSLFGKNKTVRQRKVQEFEDLFDGDFLIRSKLARLASELGENGTAGILPRQFTGRSSIGPITGGAIGGLPGAAIGAAASSPRIAAGTLGTLDIIGEKASKLGPQAKPAGEALRRALQRIGSEQFRSKE